MLTLKLRHSIFTMCILSTVLYSQTPVLEQPLIQLKDRSIHLGDIWQPESGQPLPAFDQLRYLAESAALDHLAQTNSSYQAASFNQVHPAMLQMRYQAMPDLQEQGFEAAKPVLERLVKAEMQAANRLALLQLAKQNGDLINQMENAHDLQYQLDLSPFYFEGNPEAHQVLVQFTDPNCGYCRKLEPILESLRQQYDGDLAFVSAQFPIATASETSVDGIACAAAQGLYRAAYQTLLTDAQTLDETRLFELAETWRLPNLDGFKACVASQSQRETVKTHIEAGLAMGIQGTPSFFIGTYDRTNHSATGRIVRGYRSLQDFKRDLQRHSAAL